MNRLTEFHNGIWGMSVQAVKDGYDRYSVFSKLAEYENLNEKCIELTGCGLEMLAMKYKEFMDDIAELYSYRQAEEQGLLIKLPAPIGAEYSGICREQIVTRTGWKTKSWIETGKVVGYMVIAQLSTEKAERDHQRDVSEIGEAWFVGENQKEEAEQALKGGSL